jgi:pre-mRNA-processing factor 39
VLTCLCLLCCLFFILSVFVRGSSVLSTDSAASLFWDKYLEFELTQFASPAVQAQLQVLPPPYSGTLIGGVYALVLSLPLRDLDKYWLSFSQKFAVNYPLNYIASPQEAEEYTAAYPKDIPADRATYIAPDGTQQTMTLTVLCDDWENKQRRTLLAKREYTFRVSLALRDEKHLFEYAISRPYFHVAPLTPPELANWNNFLDHMETKLMRSTRSRWTSSSSRTR